MEVKEPEIYYGILGKYRQHFSDPMLLVHSANQGLTTSTMDDLIRISRRSRESFAERLSISVKTIERYKKENKSFDPLKGELILKWVQMYLKGIEVFGSARSFNNWLSRPAAGLGGIVPDEITTTTGGINLILDELIRIEFGDLS